MHSAILGDPFRPAYVYLPLYAQLLAALFWPFHLLGIRGQLLAMYLVHIPVFAAYLYSAKLMAEMVPRHAGVAPLVIVLAPVTIFYIFFGTNHIVMLACLLAALHMLGRRKFFWAGLLAALGCYKFLLIPTVLVLLVITTAAAGLKSGARFAAGGLASLLPSLVYYFAYPDYLVRTLSSAGGIGGHSHHIEKFHALFLLREVGGFESWYIGNRVWLYVAIAGALLSAVLYLRRRVNVLQSLGLSAGVVALCSVEPFRLEPTVGLLWLDAVDREDSWLQIAVLCVVFVHAAAWFYPAHSRYLVFYQPAARFFDMNGTALGVAVAGLLVVTLLRGGGEGLLSDLRPSR
jgi:hypothetical protein